MTSGSVSGRGYEKEGSVEGGAVLDTPPPSQRGVSTCSSGKVRTRFSDGTTPSSRCRGGQPGWVGASIVPVSLRNPTVSAAPSRTVSSRCCAAARRSRAAMRKSSAVLPMGLVAGWSWASPGSGGGSRAARLAGREDRARRPHVRRVAGQRRVLRVLEPAVAELAAARLRVAAKDPRVARRPALCRRRRRVGLARRAASSGVGNDVLVAPHHRDAIVLGVVPRMALRLQEGSDYSGGSSHSLVPRVALLPAQPPRRHRSDATEAPAEGRPARSPRALSGLSLQPMQPPSLQPLSPRPLSPRPLSPRPLQEQPRLRAATAPGRRWTVSRGRRQARHAFVRRSALDAVRSSGGLWILEQWPRAQ